MRNRAWIVFAVLAATCSAAYFTQDGALAKLLLYCPVGFASAAAVVLGVRLHRPAERRAWLLVAGGLACFAAGDLVFYGHEVLTGEAAPFPYWSDVLYLGCYVFLMAGPLRLITAMCGRDRSSMVDAAIVSTAVGLPLWVFFIFPYAVDSSSPLLARVVAVAYPLADLGVLAVVARLWFAPVRRPLAVTLLGWAAAPLLVADVVYGALNVAGTWRTGTWVDAGWLLFYALPGIAALHPSLGDRLHQATGRPALTPVRGAGLMLATMVAPGMLVVQATAGTAIAALPVAAAFILLTGLVLVRVSLLVDALASTQATARSEAHFHALIAGGSDLITLVRRDGRVRYQSPSSSRVLGREAAELVGQDLLELAHPQDRSRLADYLARVFDRGAATPLEVRLRGGDNRWQWVETLASSPSEDEDGELCVVLTSRDVGERKDLEEQLTRQALHDPLTGLANRRLFHDRVSHALAQRGGGDLAVLFLDLDDFKGVNDTLGHGAGDALLNDVARRLAGAVRAGDTVARLGGDEFAVLLEQDVQPGTAEQIATRLLEALAEPVLVAGHELRTSVSIGIAPAFDGDDSEAVLRNADLAMYMAKGSGKGRHATYQPEMYAATLGRLELLADLRRAIVADELRLHYQPTVDLGTGLVTSVEALVRWQHPVRGLISPAAFIPLAEETGLIIPLGRWVLTEACREAATWPTDEAGAAPSIAVNISTRHLAEADVVQDVVLALTEAGLPADRLVVEITETGLVDDTDVVLDALNGLKRVGVHLAVDDFGTGYSSLSYLRRFPIDVLKVDKSFVDGLGQGAEAAALVEAILGMARTMSMRTVAEGIEERSQLSELTVLGCDSGQGYLLSRPVPPEQIGALLARDLRGVAVEPA